jgi:hypothetical protein
VYRSTIRLCHRAVHFVRALSACGTVKSTVCQSIVFGVPEYPLCARILFNCVLEFCFIVCQSPISFVPEYCLLCASVLPTCARVLSILCRVLSAACQRTAIYARILSTVLQNTYFYAVLQITLRFVIEYCPLSVRLLPLSTLLYVTVLSAVCQSTCWSTVHCVSEYCLL